MVEVRPDEISTILRQQLGNVSTEAQLEEVGTVLQVGDGIARVYGLNNVRSGELVEFENGTRAIALNLEEDNVGVVLMGESEGIKEGAKAKRTGKIASIKVGDGIVGRIDVAGSGCDTNQSAHSCIFIDVVRGSVGIGNGTNIKLIQIVDGDGEDLIGE